jgi:hypothetical protein
MGAIPCRRKASRPWSAPANGLLREATSPIPNDEIAHPPMLPPP